MRHVFIVGGVALALTSILLVKIVGGGLLSASGQLAHAQQLLVEDRYDEAAQHFADATQRFAPEGPDWALAAKGLAHARVAREPDRACLTFLALADQYPDAYQAADYRALAEDLVEADAASLAAVAADAGLRRFPEDAELGTCEAAIHAAASAGGDATLVEHLDGLRASRAAAANDAAE